MNARWRKILMLTVLAACCLSVETAFGCPMCKTAAEADTRLPHAFMVSILFMLAMPFSIATVFGIVFYRLSRQVPANAVTSGEPEAETGSGG